MSISSNLTTNELMNVFRAGDYMLEVNNRTTRTRCEICSKLTIKTPERRQRHHTYFTPSSISSSSCISISNVEHVIDGWVCDISLACEGLLMPPPPSPRI